MPGGKTTSIDFGCFITIELASMPGGKTTSFDKAFLRRLRLRALACRMYGGQITDCVERTLKQVKAFKPQPT